MSIICSKECPIRRECICGERICKFGIIISPRNGEKVQRCEMNEGKYGGFNEDGKDMCVPCYREGIIRMLEKESSMTLSQIEETKLFGSLSNLSKDRMSKH